MNSRGEAKIAAAIVVIIVVIGVAVFFVTRGPGGGKEPIYIATVDDLSGPYAASGLSGARGVRLALEEADYEVLGRPIKYIQRDTELKPKKGVRKMREVIDKFDPIVVNSGCSSAVQLAMCDVAKDEKQLFFSEGWDTRITGKRGSKYVFRWDASNFARAQGAAVAMLDEFPEIKTAYIMSMDYAWGYDISKQGKKVFKERGIEVVGEDYVPIGETDFSPYISKALATNPDLIYLSQYGTNLINAAKQLHEYGAKEKTKILFPGDGLVMLRGIGAEALEGMYVGNDWFYTVKNEWSKDFTEKFLKRFDLTPGYYAANAYLKTKHLLKAIEETGGTDTEKIIEWLEGYEYDGPTGSEYYREWDHQIIHDYYLFVGKSPDEMERDDDFLRPVATGRKWPTREDYEEVWSEK